LLARIDHDPAAATPEMRAAFHDGETRFGNDIKALEAEQQRLPH
jgi:hypothetical protein